MWKFNETATTEEINFNPLLDKFFKLGLDGLIRENIQNSLDGKRDDKDFVEVHIKLGEIDSKDLIGIEEIKEHIMSLYGENQYTPEILKNMKKNVKQERVHYISFEDRNTKGLSGADRGSNYEAGDTYGIYAYKKGVHGVDKDKIKENLRGGSHGVGKIASNAASQINLMYFSNCDEEGRKHLGGTIQLIEHKYKDKCYRATGYFTKMKDNVFYPFENTFSEVFRKDTQGLKIIIPFLRICYRSKKEIVSAVCDSFFVAILEKKLVVYVDDLRIDSENLKSILFNEKYYEIQEVDKMKNNFTQLYYRTYTEGKPEEPIVIEDKFGNEYRFWLYFKYNENIVAGRVGIIRSIGMKIEDFKVSGKVRAAYNAVLIPYSSEEDMFLKSLENESHTEITFEFIRDPEDQKNAKRFLNNLSKKVSEIIDEKMQELNPTDGKIDTEDLIYNIESNFRNILKQKTSILELNEGNKKKEKVASRTNNKYDKKKQKEEKEKPAKKVDNGNRKIGSEEKRINKETYSLPRHCVKRVSLGNEEYIQINIKEAKIFKGQQECDVFFKLVDGTGKEEEKRYNISENYEKIIDSKDSTTLSVKDNCIKNVKIHDGVVYLKNIRSGNGNKMLKFIYYMEV